MNRTKSRIFQVLLGLGILAGLAAIICTIAGISGGAICLMASFVLLALGFQGHPILKGFSYTLFIFAASTYALNYPENLVAYQGFPLKKLVTPLLIITMFGMGIHMNLTRFVEIAKSPKPILAGIFCHYLIYLK